MAAPHSLTADKAALRRAALARRGTPDPALAEAVCARLLALDLPAGATIAGVWPLPGEIDLRPALAALAARGHGIVLPETPPRGLPLVFRRWRPGAAMVRERFGTFRPEGEVAVPDILLVPLLAFDAALYRLGYGGGYYDRTLAALPGRTALGFGAAWQRVDRLPREPHDRALDAVITEAGVMHPA